MPVSRTLVFTAGLVFLLGALSFSQSPAITSVSPNPAARGAVVTVSGSNFGTTQDSSTLTLNGIVTPVSSWSDATLTFTVPQSAYSGPLVVNRLGQPSNSFTLDIPTPSQPAPLVMSLTASSATPGSVIGILGSNLRPPYDPLGNPLGNVGVLLANQSLTVKESSNSALTVQIPAETTVGGNITVSVNGQTSAPVAFTLDANSPGVQHVTLSYFTQCHSGPPEYIPVVATNIYTLLGSIVSQTRSATLQWSSNSRAMCPSTQGNNPFTDYMVGVGRLTDTYSTPSASPYVDWEIVATGVRSAFWNAFEQISIDGPNSGAFHIWGINYYQSPAPFRVFAGAEAGDAYASPGSGDSIPVGRLTMFQDPIGPDPVDLGECCDGAVGHPINVMNGNVYVQQTDFAFPGLAGGLELQRTWNSLFESAASFTEGWFGSSWMSTFDEYLDHTLPGGDVRYYRADGSAWYFIFDNLSGSFALTQPADERASLAFDSQTALFTIHFKDGSYKQFHQDGFPHASFDRNHNRQILFTYSGDHLTEVEDAARRKLYFDYSDNANPNKITRVRTDLGVSYVYSYDVDGRLLQVNYPDGTSVHHQYDAAGLLLFVRDLQGIVLESHTYDSMRRGLTSSRAGNVSAVTLTYPSTGIPIVTDSLSRTTQYTFGAFGGKLRLSNVNGEGCSTCATRGNTTMLYNDRGELMSRTNANGQIQDKTYDVSGNIASSTVHIGSQSLTSTFTYNSFGQVLTATDPAGNVMTNTYDTNGNLLTTTTPSPSPGIPGSTTTYRHLPNGLVESITDPGGKNTQFTYNAAGLLEAITDAESSVTTFEYDARGNRTAIVDAAQNRTEFKYDLMNRLTRVTNPDGTDTHFGYDYRGRRTSVTDANGTVTTYAYDDADRLVSVTDSQTPSPGVTTYSYDTENNLTSITDARGRTTSFTYDARGRVTRTTFPSTLFETYNYDNLGNLLIKVDRKNQTITYGYDSLNRLTSKTLGTTGQVTYSYDNLSRLTQAQNGTGTYDLGYDNLGRLTNTTTQYSFVPGQTYSMSYGYDAASNRRSFTDPRSGITNYVYDKLDRLESLTNPLSQQFTFAYDNLSRRTSLARPNGVITTHSYDNLSRLLSVSHEDAARQVIDGATYTVDHVGNRISKANLQSGIKDAYAYDAIYQLTQVTKDGNPAEVYNYDKVGNRTSSHLSATYTVNNSNQLTATANATYTYDNNGNTLTKTVGTDVTTYTWDYENRLTQVALPGGSIFSFQYDPFGRRIQKSSAAGTINYLYDGANIVEELDPSGAVLARYTQGTGIDEPLAMERSGVSSYYHADGLGSITALTDSAGKIDTTYTNDAYGQTTNEVGSLINPFRYTGREWDPELGLYYYRARWYSPHTGRFISEDPIQLFGGSNFYEFVGNSPLIHKDPSGLARNVPYRWRYCYGKEKSQCKSICAAQGKEYESCMVSQTYRIGPGGMTIGPEFIDGPLSCSCKSTTECHKASLADARAADQLKRLFIGFGIAGGLAFAPELLPLLPQLWPQIEPAFAH